MRKILKFGFVVFTEKLLYKGEFQTTMAHGESLEEKTGCSRSESNVLYRKVKIAGNILKSCFTNPFSDTYIDRRTGDIIPPEEVKNYD